MKHLVLSAILFLSAAAAVWAADSATFEVASIKPNKSGSGESDGGKVPGPNAKEHSREKIEVAPGTLNIRNATLAACIRWAYHVKDFQVSGPDWRNSERFDVSAKASEPASEEQLRLTFQKLLANRFKLALHRVSKQLPVFALLVGKDGPKLRESNTEGESVIKTSKFGVSARRALPRRSSTCGCCPCGVPSLT